MATESILDRLDREPGGCRRWISQLVVVGGATRAQVAAKLQERYGVSVTTRSLTSWYANDEQLKALIEELEDVRRDMNPDASPADLLAAVPEPIDRAEAVADLYAFLDEFPVYGELIHRAELDPDCDDDAAAQVLLEDHADDAAFEAACRERLGDWDIHIALGAEPGYKERVERVMAESSTRGAAVAKSRERYVDGPEID
jgi:hypothetical protein